MLKIIATCSIINCLPVIGHCLRELKLLQAVWIALSGLIFNTISKKSLFCCCPLGRHVELLLLTAQNWNQLTNTALLVVCCLEQLALVPAADATSLAHFLQVWCGYIYRVGGSWAICQRRSVLVPTPKLVNEDLQKRELCGSVQDSWSVQRFSHYFEVTAEGKKLHGRLFNCSPPILTPWSLISVLISRD